MKNLGAIPFWILITCFQALTPPALVVALGVAAYEVVNPPPSPYETMASTLQEAERNTHIYCSRENRTSKTEYFDYDRCFRENYPDFEKEALYRRQEWLTRDTSPWGRFKSSGGFTFALLGFIPGVWMAFSRWGNGDKRWWFFWPYSVD